MLGLIIMWIIVLAGGVWVAIEGIKDSEEYIDYEDYTPHEDSKLEDHNDYEEEQITVLRHYPDGTVEIQQ